MRKKKATQEYPVCREWSLRSPDGEIYRFRNMSYFVAEYVHLFDDYELEQIREYPRAYYMLSRLSPSRKYKLKSWHGWTWGE